MKVNNSLFTSWNMWTEVSCLMTTQWLYWLFQDSKPTFELALSLSFRLWNRFCKVWSASCFFFKRQFYKMVKNTQTNRPQIWPQIKKHVLYRAYVLQNSPFWTKLPLAACWTFLFSNFVCTWLLILYAMIKSLKGSLFQILQFGFWYFQCWIYIFQLIARLLKVRLYF